MLQQRGHQKQASWNDRAKPYSIDGGCYKSLILDKVILAIAEKFPLGMKAKPMYLQHNHAPPHTSVFSSLPDLVKKTGSLGSWF